MRRFASVSALVLTIAALAGLCVAQKRPSAAHDQEKREVEDAIRLLATGGSDQFISALHALAEKGNVEAQLFLGGAYKGGNDLIKEPDYSEAMKWYRRASAQGSGEASAAVAELYEQGSGVPKSTEEANAWWKLATRQGWDQQDLDVLCFALLPGRDPLSCEPWYDGTGCPSESEMQALQASGVTGRLRPTGGGAGRSRLGPKARAIIVMDHQIPTEQRLKQPRHTNVIYVQQGDTWELLPKDAPLLERPIVLYAQSDEPRHIMAGVQDVDGSLSAGGCISWPLPK